METYQTTHSMKVVVSVIAALTLGMIFLYTLPVVTDRGTNDFGDSTTYNAKYGEVKAIMSLFGGDWANTLLWIGLVAAVGAAIMLPLTQWGRRLLRSAPVQSR